MARGGDGALSDRQRLDRLFDAALDLPAAERAALFEREGASPEEREKVARLLARAGEAGGGPVLGAALWGELSLRLAGPGLAPGDRLGAYRVLRDLGRGGMAVVVLAERADGLFEQRVALKVLDRPADDARAVERFHQERRILASLEHPNIARLFDGGIAPDGRPYFAMEYVEGLPIDRYCDEGGLGLAERLRLFAVVGKAVAAAHRQLVVHRDLKPSNVLVSKEGIPKLLDFGIAKLVELEGGAPPGGALGSAGPLPTATRVMTPEYASPEQWTGQPVTTASDVYQMGLLLYELLVGERPFPFPASTPTEAAQRAATREPTRPSAAAARAAEAPEAGLDRARRRGCGSPRQLGKLLSGDLDTIVLAALRPEVERRYPSVDRLVDDVERFLAGRPILARPDSLAYRGRKFVARHRWSVAAGFAGLAVIAALSLFYTLRLRQERDAAEREAAKAQRVADFLAGLFQGSDPFTSKNVATLTALELLDVGARRIETELSAEPEVRASLLHTIGTVYRRQAKFEPAERLLRQAEELRTRSLGEDDPATLASRWELGMILFLADRAEEALDLQLRVLAARERTLEPDDPLLGLSHAELANVLDRLGRFEEARAAAERAVSIYRSGNRSTPLHLAWGHLYLGRALGNLGRLEEALPHRQEAVALLKANVDPQHPSIAPFISELAHVYCDLDRIDDCRRTYAEALQAAAASPRVVPVQTALIRIAAARAANLAASFEEARTLAEDGMSVVEGALGPDSYWIGLAHVERARAFHGLGRPEAGLETIVEARRLLVAAFGEGSEDVRQCDEVKGELAAAVEGRRGGGPGG